MNIHKLSKRERERFDFDIIARWIPAGERVLDLGCGDGNLLRYLSETKRVEGYGVEINPQSVLQCVRNGVNVLQIDNEGGLSGFEDLSFDHAIISQALQAMHATERILGEMLRVAGEAVVSFPNFAYRTNRSAVAKGHMPVSPDLPYEWYDTPNVRFFTLVDFEALCAQLGIEIREKLAFDETGRRVTDDPNLNGSLAFYLLGRSPE
ncbi:MAG: methionine biosynthesis protein MetW [Candidatus Accumulibacter sp.]|jgi:methionine biosynthesis protein MetW|nr:methionine biosynthesis protein MetW [Accumulibacter sp.]